MSDSQRCPFKFYGINKVNDIVVFRALKVFNSENQLHLFCTVVGECDYTNTMKTTFLFKF